MKLITNLDGFGKEFHFYINQQYVFKSFIGGCFSIITGICLLIAIYFFGKPLWYHKSPTVTTTYSTTEDYEKFNFQNKQIIFPFKLEDGFGASFNYSNLFYLEVKYFNYNLLKDQSNYQENGLEFLPLTKCSEFDNIINGEKEEIYNSFYCLNFTGREVGGNWDGDFIKQFTVSLNYCPSNVTVYDSKVCSSFDQLSTIIAKKQKIYFSYFIPVIYLQPENYSLPIRMEYEYTYKDLSPKTRTTQTIYFGKYIIADNTNWIYDSKKEDLFFEIEENKESKDYIDKEDFIDGNPVHPLYSITIKGSKKETIISRKYMKIPEILAVSCSILNIARFILGIICEFLNILEQSFFLYHVVFTKDPSLFNSYLFQDKKKGFTPPTMIRNKPIFDGAYQKNKSLSMTGSKISLDQIGLKDSWGFWKPNSTNHKSLIQNKYSNYSSKKFLAFLCPFSYKNDNNSFKKYGEDFIKKRFDVLTYNNIVKDFSQLKGIVLSKNGKNNQYEQNKILYNNYCGESYGPLYDTSPKPQEVSYDVDKGINKSKINNYCDQSQFKKKCSSNQTI